MAIAYLDGCCPVGNPKKRMAASGKEDFGGKKTTPW